MLSIHTYKNEISMKLSLFFTIFCVQVLFPQINREAIENKMSNLPDVRFELVDNDADNGLTYKLFIKQPVDHADYSKGFFEQLAMLTHKGFDRPVVMSTQGYHLYTEKNELAMVYDANHLNIEHRYFGVSIPKGRPWEYLTLEQATADLHHINQLFKQIYKNKWISTGISKGGQTTIFYRYFYPGDVDVSVPYVAPINNSIEDKRIYKFLDTVGTAACRDKIEKFQKYLLQHRSELLPKLKWYAKGAGLYYGYLGSIEKAYEYAVLEYSFSFWQSGYLCNVIPGLDDTDKVIDHFLSVSNISFFSDESMEKYAPHYYQAATQMGYYGYNIKPFKDGLKYFTANPSAVFPPKDAADIEYDSTLNRKLKKWLNKEGNGIIYIYGGSDTWSADMVIPSKKVNSVSFIIPNEDHYGARVKNMSPEMRKEFAAFIEKWIGLKPDFSKLKPF